MNRGAVAVPMLLVTALSACGGRSSSSFARGRGGPTSIQIYVDNQNFSDMTLPALTNRGPQPLGRIGGSSQRTFTLDWRDWTRFGFASKSWRVTSTRPIRSTQLRETGWS